MLNATHFIVAAMMTCCFAAAPKTTDDVGKSPDPWKKVEIDLTKLDENGLRGPPDGKVAVSYEFAIPNTDKCRAEVKKIDRSAQIMPGSRGRIGAGKDECLCIGTTNKDYRKVLKRLAELDYVRRIIQCHFE